MNRPGHGTDLYTPGGNVNCRKGRVMARAFFAESFGILRKNVVNLRENPVSSRVVLTCTKWGEILCCLVPACTSRGNPVLACTALYWYVQVRTGTYHFA